MSPLSQRPAPIAPERSACQCIHPLMAAPRPHQTVGRHIAAGERADSDAKVSWLDLRNPRRAKAPMDSGRRDFELATSSLEGWSPRFPWCHKGFRADTTSGELFPSGSMPVVANTDASSSRVSMVGGPGHNFHPGQLFISESCDRLRVRLDGVRIAAKTLSPRPTSRHPAQPTHLLTGRSSRFAADPPPDPIQRTDRRPFRRPLRVHAAAHSPARRRGRAAGKSRYAPHSDRWNCAAIGDPPPELLGHPSTAAAFPEGSRSMRRRRWSERVPARVSPRPTAGNQTPPAR